MDLSKEKVDPEVIPLIKEAKLKGLWLEYFGFPNMTCSPSELELNISYGQCNWPARHWKLIDPLILLADPEVCKLEAIEHNNRIMKRIQNDRSLTQSTS